MINTDTSVYGQGCSDRATWGAASRSCCVRAPSPFRWHPLVGGSEGAPVRPFGEKPPLPTG
eukprot:12903761-Alexandrium_andersonii.AAC.1